MKPPLFRGLFPIVHTPFTANGEVDYGSLQRLVRHVGSQTVDGMVFPGFASEFWRMSDAEIFECAECIAAESPSTIELVFNVTPQASVPAMRAAREFARLGASALMTLPPFLIPVPACAIETHLGQVLGATALPCIVQDSAGLTGTTLDAQMLSRLRESHPNFAALKVDQVPTGPAISRYRAAPQLAGMSYVVGYSGVQMLDAVRRGAEGLMGGCGHLREDRRMLDALLGGDEEKGYRAYARLAPLLNFEMQTLELAIAVHKALLFESGIIATPHSRRPCGALDDVHREELRMHMSALHTAENAS